MVLFKKTIFIFVKLQIFFCVLGAGQNPKNERRISELSMEYERCSCWADPEFEEKKAVIYQDHGNLTFAGQNLLIVEK